RPSDAEPGAAQEVLLLPLDHRARRVRGRRRGAAAAERLECAPHAGAVDRSRGGGGDAGCPIAALATAFHSRDLPQRAAELARTRRGEPQYAHSWYQPAMFA